MNKDRFSPFFDSAKDIDRYSASKTNFNSVNSFDSVVFYFLYFFATIMCVIYYRFIYFLFHPTLYNIILSSKLGSALR